MRPIDADALYESLWEAGMVFALRMVEIAPTIAEPPNDPLTLSELREMDGEPVWIDDWYEDFHGWELSETASDYFEGESRTVEAYGTRWVAYRRKPEEEK